MNEFKFNCPKCGQHILANATWIGRRLNCPSCNTRIAVPAPTKPQKEKLPLATSPKVSKPALLPGGLKVEPPTKPDKNRTPPAKELKQTEPPAAAPTISKSSSPTAHPQGQPQVKPNIPKVAEPKIPKQTQPPTTAPAATESKPPPSRLRAEPPVKADKSQMSPAKESQPIESPAAASVVPQSKPPTVAIPPTTDQRLQPQAKRDKVQDAAAKTPSKTETPSVAPAVAEPKSPDAPSRVELPAKTADTETAPTTAVPLPAKVTETSAPAAPDAAEPPEQPRVAVLTPAVKLEMVRAVRRRITNESAWLPGKVEGNAAYAAKMQDGKPVLLDVKSSEATHFSLMGAVLLEMHARQVIPTASGRKKFLDQEIPDAIGEMLLNEMSEEEREHSENPLADKDPLTISHAQCLAVLDVMEERYSERMEQLRIEKARKRLGKVRLPDLVKTLEKKGRVLPEDVATALYHEVMDLRRRLDRLESRLSQNK